MDLIKTGHPGVWISPAGAGAQSAFEKLRSLNEQFYRGLIRQPEGNGERIVVGKATKALAQRMATTEANKLNWDWFVQRCRVDGEGEDQVITVLEQWSSLAGHEILE